MKQTYALFFLLLFALSCSGNKSDRKTTGTSEPVALHFTEGETLCPLDICSNLYIKKPQNIHTVGNYLLIENPTDCGYLTLFNPETRQSVYHGFTKKAPSFRYSETETEQTTISLFGNVTAILYRYTVDKGTITFHEAVNLKNVEGTPTAVYPLNDGLYVGIGIYRQGLLALIDKQYKQISFFGNYPLNEYLPEKGPDYYILSTYDGCIEGSSDNRHIFYASRRYGYISCYSIKNKRMERQWEKRLTEPKYSRRKDQLDMKPDHQYGFSDLRTAGNHIYALYEGNYHSPSEAALSDPPQKILVYTMDGTTAAEYTVPGKVIHIDVDKEEKYLYTVAVAKDDDPYTHYLIRYPLQSGL